MARRTNYGFEKRQKEMQRQKKKEKKLVERRARKQGEASGEVGENDQEEGTDADGGRGEGEDAE